MKAQPCRRIRNTVIFLQQNVINAIKIVIRASGAYGLTTASGRWREDIALRHAVIVIQDRTYIINNFLYEGGNYEEEYFN